MNTVDVPLGRYDLIQAVEAATGATAMEHFCDPENGIDFPEDDEEDAQEEDGTWM